MGNDNKSTIYVSVMNMYAKFQLTVSEEKIFQYFFENLPFMLHGNQSNSAIWTNFIWILEDYSRNISVK